MASYSPLHFNENMLDPCSPLLRKTDTTTTMRSPSHVSLASVRGPSAIPSLLATLNDTYDELVLQLRNEKEQQDREIKAAWDAVEHERAAIRNEWAMIKAEKSRLFIRGSGPGNDAAQEERTGDPSLAHRWASPSRGSAALSFSRESAQRCHSECSRTPLQNPQWITVWSGINRQGDRHRLLLSNFRTFQQLLGRAAHELGLQPAAGQLYSPDGLSINSLDELEPDADYLLLPSGCRYREDTVPTALLKKIISRSVLARSSSAF